MNILLNFITLRTLRQGIRVTAHLNATNLHLVVVSDRGPTGTCLVTQTLLTHSSQHRKMGGLNSIFEEMPLVLALPDVQKIRYICSEYLFAVQRSAMAHYDIFAAANDHVSCRLLR